MTETIDTAQPEALRLAAWLNEGAWHQMRLGDVEAAGRELRRLHAALAAAEARNATLTDDATLGRIAMKFVDRAGDVHPGIDDAETICAEFYAAMSKELDDSFNRCVHTETSPIRRAVVRAAASISTKGDGHV